MALKGSANSLGIPDIGINGQVAYGWEHDCTGANGTWKGRCRENIYQNGDWIANGLVSDNKCPLIETNDFCGVTDPDGTGTGNNNNGSTDSLFGGVTGGLFPFGLGNIFGPASTNFLNKASMIIGLAIAALLLIMFMRKK